MRPWLIVAALLAVQLGAGCKGEKERTPDRGAVAELENAIRISQKPAGKEVGGTPSADPGQVPPASGQPPAGGGSDAASPGVEQSLDRQAPLAPPTKSVPPTGILPPAPRNRAATSGPGKVHLVLDRSRSLPVAWRGWKRQGIRPEVYERFVDRLDVKSPMPTVWLLPGESEILDRSTGLTEDFPLLAESMHTPLKAFIKDYWLGKRPELAGETLILITDMKDEPVPEQSWLVGPKELGRLIADLLSGEAGAATIPEEVRLVELIPPDLPDEADGGAPEPLFVLTIVRHEKDAKLVAEVLLALTQVTTDAGWRVSEFVLDHLGNCVDSVGRGGAKASLFPSCLEMQVETVTYRDEPAGKDRSVLQHREECPTLSIGNLSRALKDSGGSQVAFEVSVNLKAFSPSWQVKRLFVHGRGSSDDKSFDEPVSGCSLSWSGGTATGNGTPTGYVATGTLLLSDGRSFRSGSGLGTVYLGAELTYSPVLNTNSDYLKQLGEEVVSGVPWFKEVSYLDENSCSALYLLGQGATAALGNLTCAGCLAE